jgi:hypothetical protein
MFFWLLPNKCGTWSGYFMGKWLIYMGTAYDVTPNIDVM